MRIVFIFIYAIGAQPSLSGRAIILIISNINNSLYAKQQRTHHTIFVINVYLSNNKFCKDIAKKAKG
jgi:hypothetical protein